MSNARDYVETVVINQLNRRSELDREVDDLYFQCILSKLQKNIEYYSTYTKVTGFTQEDLQSFLSMKVHQVLRRKEINHNKRLRPYFIRAFSNFIKDLHKINDRAIARGMDTDLLDYITQDLKE